MGYQFPQYYQPYYQPPMPDQLTQLRQYQVQPQPAQQNMVWVSGEQEAMAYLVAPNSAVALWDSNCPTIYLKKADASGKPMMQVFDLVERTGAPKQTNSEHVEFATKAELDALAARVEALSGSKTQRKPKEDVE